MIILFRHAKPIIDYSSCNYDGAINRLNDYNSTLELKFDDLGSLSDDLKAMCVSDEAGVIP
jgi:hypothetical protein